VQRTIPLRAGSNIFGSSKRDTSEEKEGRIVGEENLLEKKRGQLGVLIRTEKELPSERRICQNNPTLAGYNSSVKEGGEVVAWGS